MMAASWIHGSRAMVTVNSIFAGFSGALMSGVLSLDYAPNVRCGAAILAVIALVSFALAAEKVTDALDEGDVKRYVWSMQFHNVGVMFVLLSLSMYLYLRLMPTLVFLVPVFAALYWLKDFVVLWSRKEREEYIALISMDEPPGTTRR